MSGLVGLTTCPSKKQRKRKNDDDDDDDDDRDDGVGNDNPAASLARNRKRRSTAAMKKVSTEREVPCASLGEVPCASPSLDGNKIFQIMCTALKMNRQQNKVMEGNPKVNSDLVDIIVTAMKSTHGLHSSKRPFANSAGPHNGSAIINSWPLANCVQSTNDPNELEASFDWYRNSTFQHGVIDEEDGNRMCISLAIDGAIYLSMSPNQNQAGPILVDAFTLNNQDNFFSSGSVSKDFNKPVGMFILSYVITQCNSVLVQGYDSKKLLPEVFKELGLHVITLTDAQLQEIIPECPMPRSWSPGNEQCYPLYLTYDKKTAKTCCIVTCPQIGSSVCLYKDYLQRLRNIKLSHLLVRTFLIIAGAKYCEKHFPPFTTPEESILWSLQTKSGADEHLALLRDANLIENGTTYKCPSAVGGAGTLGVRKGKSVEWLVLKSMPPSNSGSHCADTQRKIAAQLVHEGIGFKLMTTCNYMNQWYNNANSNQAKSTQIESRRGEKTWRLSISGTKPKNIPEVDMAIYINNTEASREAERISKKKCRDKNRS